MISSTKALCSFPSLYVQKRSIATLSNKTARLTQDGVFKTLFQDAANPSKLIHFLSAIAPEKKIRKLEFQDSYFPAYSRGEKDIYVDIVCKIWEENQTNPEIFVIEMQQADKKGVFKRWDFYASRCYTSELLKAKTYDNLLKVHVIAIMMHPSPYPNDTYHLVGKTTGTRIDESRSITLISLSDTNKMIPENASALEKWCHLIKFSGTADLNSQALKGEAVFSQVISELTALEKTPEKIPGARSRTSKGTPWHLLNKQLKESISKQ